MPEIVIPPRAPIVGEIVHYVLEEGRSVGEDRPAIIVRIWDPVNNPWYVNLQVITDDSNDGLPAVVWKTSRIHSHKHELGTWHFPEEQHPHKEEK